MAEADIYYNRVMHEDLTKLISEKYQWLIEYVKNCPELDFQTGSNANDTWFSIYRGTGRVLTIKKNGSLIADEKYKGLFPSFYKSPNKNNLDCLMKEITKEDDLKKYYIGKDGKKKEGYYQNLISRRYSLFCKPQDDFIIIDKEFVLGYSDDEIKKMETNPIKDKYDNIIESLKKKKFGTGIKCPGAECDFVGLTKNGDILLLELKRYEDTSKIALSPVQVGKYVDLTENYLSKYKTDFEKNVLEMVRQKVDLGILVPKFDIPKKISGRIIPAVVVGGNPTETAKERFIIARDMVKKPNIKLYTCSNDGELIEIAL
ncbi:MAG: hypothetical protein J6X18_04980 [Bacteroidales bacterium]|nr:hypothetical protein [Bacteroidales bacterium]